MSKLEPWADSPYHGNRAARWEDLGNGSRVIFGTMQLAPINPEMYRTIRSTRAIADSVIDKAMRGVE